MLLVAGPTLLRQEADGALVPHADLAAFGTTPFNDIVVDDRGNAYVNNIGFDFGEGEVQPGFVLLVRPDGQARIVADRLMFPNGMAVTADGRTLVVAESYASCLTAYDIDEDGGLSGRRVWADLGEDNPDGICLDAEGAAWYADVPHAHCRRVAEEARCGRPSSSDGAGSPVSWADPTDAPSMSSPTSGVRKGRSASAAAPSWRSTWPFQAPGTRSLSEWPTPTSTRAPRRPSGR